MNERTVLRSSVFNDLKEIDFTFVDFDFLRQQIYEF